MGDLSYTMKKLAICLSITGALLVPSYAVAQDRDDHHDGAHRYYDRHHKDYHEWNDHEDRLSCVLGPASQTSRQLGARKRTRPAAVLGLATQPLRFDLEDRHSLSRDRRSVCQVSWPVFCEGRPVSEAGLSFVYLSSRASGRMLVSLMAAGRASPIISFMISSLLRVPSGTTAE